MKKYVYTKQNLDCFMTWKYFAKFMENIKWMAGGIQRGGAPGARPPKIEKNMIFWCKIMIFHTKYPKNVHISLRSARFF